MHPEMLVVVSKEHLLVKVIHFSSVRFVRSVRTLNYNFLWTIQ